MINVFNRCLFLLVSDIHFFFVVIHLHQVVKVWFTLACSPPRLPRLGVLVFIRTDLEIIQTIEKNMKRHNSDSAYRRSALKHFDEACRTKCTVEEGVLMDIIAVYSALCPPRGRPFRKPCSLSVLLCVDTSELQLLPFHAFQPLIIHTACWMVYTVKTAGVKTGAGKSLRIESKVQK